MSSYSVNNLRFTLRARAAAAADDILAAGMCTLDSQSLCQVTTARLSGTPQEVLAHRWALLGSLAGGRDAVAGVNEGALADAHVLSQQAFAARASGNQLEASRLAASADQALVSVVGQTVDTLRTDELVLGATLANQALAQLGYSVTIATGDRSTGLWAEREHHVVAVLVQEGGVMEIDNAGLAGGDCVAPMHELQQALVELGADGDIVRRVDHGDDRGGHLIQRACKVDARQPAAGIVRQHEVGILQSEETGTELAERRPQLEVNR